MWQVRLRTAISPYTLLYFRVQGATIKLTHTLIETRFQKPAVKGAIINHTHTHTHPFNGRFFRDYPGEPVPER